MARVWHTIVGILEWAITFVNDKGNISHSKQGMMFFQADDIFPELSDATKQKIRDDLAKTYGWECDEGYGYHLWLMECVDEEE